MSPPTACPQCGQQDHVQRVPGIVASQNTGLSWQLRAPPPPGSQVRAGRAGGVPAWIWVLLVLLLLTLPIDLLLLVVFAVVAITFAVVIGTALLVAALVFVLYRYLNREVVAERQARGRRAREEAARRYQHAAVYWNQLHYCYRCHGIFLPGHPWQYEAVTRAGSLVAPSHAWSLSGQLAEYADRFHAPDVLRLTE